MFYSRLLLLVFNMYGFVSAGYESDSGEKLIKSLKNDANLDLSEDEEYEDLRSELLAYQAAMATVIDSRRSLKTAPCGSVGGICINYKLCPGYRHVTEIPGCKNQHSVCCFVWNLYEVRDHRDEGLPNLAYPWKTFPKEFGGKGIVNVTPKRKKRRPKTRQGKDIPVVVVAAEINK